MFSKLKDFFCKTYPFFGYDFFIPVALYKRIEATEGEVSPKSIRHFFSKAPYSLSKGQIQITREADKLFFVQIAFYEENKREIFKKEIEGYKEVFPFWTVFPHSFYGAPRWNQGYQEHYRDTFWNIAPPYPPKHNRNIWINTIVPMIGGFGLRITANYIKKNNYSNDRNRTNPTPAFHSIPTSHV